MSSSSSRKGKGRQKVEMTKIGNDTNLQVTFSKRRAGLFKKASELSTLCGAESAVVVFSPGNKAHCFGHPNVDAVANRFLNGVAPVSDGDKLLQAHQKLTVNQQNQELTQIQHELEFEQKRSRELEREKKEAIRLCRRPEVEKLNYRQLERLKGALLRLRHQLQEKVDNANANSEKSVKGPDENTPTISYDPTAAGESCAIIPYSSAPSNDEH